MQSLTDSNLVSQVRGGGETLDESPNAIIASEVVVGDVLLMTGGPVMFWF